MELLKKGASLKDVINKVNELVEQRNSDVESEIERLESEIEFCKRQNKIMSLYDRL